LGETEASIKTLVKLIIGFINILQLFANISKEYDESINKHSLITSSSFYLIRLVTNKLFYQTVIELCTQVKKVKRLAIALYKN
jgi:hypothetical protein